MRTPARSVVLIAFAVLLTAAWAPITASADVPADPAPIAIDDDDPEERPRSDDPLERLFDDGIDRLKSLAERARENGNEELAEGLEQRLEELRTGARDLRRFLERREPEAEPKEEAPAPRGRRGRRDDREEPRSRSRRKSPLDREFRFGFDDAEGHKEFGFNPRTRELRILVEAEDGERVELRYRMGKGLRGLRELRERLEQLRPEQREREQEPEPRRRLPPWRRGGRTR